MPATLLAATASCISHGNGMIRQSYRGCAAWLRFASQNYLRKVDAHRGPGIIDPAWRRTPLVVDYHMTQGFMTSKFISFFHRIDRLRLGQWH
jgi:hypothetical protein